MCKLTDDEAIECIICQQFEMPWPEALRDYCRFARVDYRCVEDCYGNFDEIDFEPFIQRVEARRKENQDK